MLFRSENLGIRVVGHSDASGNAVSNQTISRARAEAVAGLLAARGVERRRIVIVSRAATQLINDQEPGLRERNRRVTLEPLLDSEETP